MAKLGHIPDEFIDTRYLEWLQNEVDKLTVMERAKEWAAITNQSQQKTSELQ